MKTTRLQIKSGLLKSEYHFNEHATLITSDKNSVGKTALMRLIVYGLGFSIPGMKGFDFDPLTVELDVLDNNNENIKIRRQKNSIELITGDVSQFFTLPNEGILLHKRIFGVDNKYILENILSVFYLDQEKGGTLLNRGVSIGINHFSIERFLLGLSERSCDELYERRDQLLQEKQKYEIMDSIATYQKDTKHTVDNQPSNDRVEKFRKTLVGYLTQKKTFEDELKQVEAVRKKNLSFVNYITQMKLQVKSHDGSLVPVNENTLEGFQDSHEYIVTRRNLIRQKIADIDTLITRLNENINRETRLLDVDTLADVFKNGVLSTPIDAGAIQGILKQLQLKRKEVQDVIRSRTTEGNPAFEQLWSLVKDYANRLDDKDIPSNKGYLLTSDLKSLSGTVLYKRVMEFKLAYIKVVRERTGCILPIILDSPSGREVLPENVNMIMEILNTDFSDHQVIIATIYKPTVMTFGHIITLTNGVLADSKFDGVPSN